MANLSVTVENVKGTLQAARIRGHVVLCDSPGSHGTDLGPTPSELFLMSLADCVAMVVSAHCRTRGVDCEGLKVTAEAQAMKGDDGVRYWGNIQITIKLPAEIPEERVKAILRHVKSGCPVTATIGRSSVDYTIHAGDPASVQ